MATRPQRCDVRLNIEHTCMALCHRASHGFVEQSDLPEWQDSLAQGGERWPPGSATVPKTRPITAPAPDRKALAAVGSSVRKRLASDPSVYRVPVEGAEIFALADFLDARECAHIVALIDQVARPSELVNLTGDEAYRTSYSGDVPQTDPVVRAVIGPDRHRPHLGRERAGPAVS
jgi:hypothetical protein